MEQKYQDIPVVYGDAVVCTVTMDYQIFVITKLGKIYPIELTQDEKDRRYENTKRIADQRRALDQSAPETKRGTDFESVKKLIRKDPK